jgi:hypothetical protein
MAKDNMETPNLFNPMMFWTDLGMRALETTLSSSQNIGDGIDRLSRANASPEASETAVAPLETISEEPAPALPAFPDLSLFWQMQRFTMELMTQGWQQWMNTLGSLASLGAGRSFADTARQNPMLNAMQEVLLRGTGETDVTGARPNASSRSYIGRKRERHADDVEHAFAAAETKRRSRAGRTTKARSRSR